MNSSLIARAVFTLVISGLMISCRNPFGSGAPQAAEPITEITLTQTTNGWGGGEAFTMLLRADGSARLETMERAGKGVVSTGTLDPDTFAELTEVLRSEGFFGMKEFYDSMITDQADTIVGATRGGQVRTVTSRGGGAPKTFNTIVEVIRATRAQIAWTVEQAP